MNLEFIKSWKFMAIIVAVLCVISTIGVFVGRYLHNEPGFMPDAPLWEPQDFPLSVCAEPYVSGEEAEAVEAVSNAADTINDRLGFEAFRMGRPVCDVRVTLGYPSESGWSEPGGNALLTRTTAGISCDVRIINAVGEVRHLTIQHELGHCLGLADENGANNVSIMSEPQVPTPLGQFPPRISDSDRNLLRERYLR